MKKHFKNIQWIVVLAILMVTHSSVFGQKLEGSAIYLGNSVNQAYSSESGINGQSVAPSKMTIEVSLDFGEVANLPSGTNAVTVDFELTDTQSGFSALSGSLKISDDKLKSTKKFTLASFGASGTLKLKVTGVNLNGGSISQYPKLRLMATPVINYKYLLMSSPEITQSSIFSEEDKNKVRLSWSYASGNYQAYFEQYEVRVLKVEPINGALPSTLNWENALVVRVNEGKQYYDFFPSEGEGYYRWQVRAIASNKPNGASDPRNIGTWLNKAYTGTYSSFFDATSGKIKTNLYDLSTVSSFSPTHSTVSDNKGEFFIASGFESSKNWSYMQQFAEGGKRKEVVTYANGLNQVKQTQTKLNSQGKVVANAQVYDYSGRAAISTMMAPTGKTYFEYDANFINGSGTTTYKASDFDTDAKLFTPTIVNSNSSLTKYYNISKAETMDDMFIPADGGYSYTRNVFTPDATGRSWIQSGAGTDLKLGNPSSSAIPHNTVVEYGAVAQDELDYVFGNEAPLAENVYKTSTRDPNGVTSINYMTKKGEVLATMLDGAKVEEYNTRLDPVSGFQLLQIKDHLDEGVLSSDGYSTYTGKTLIVAGLADELGTKVDRVDLDYSFSPSQFNLNCANICEDCDYTVVLTITSPQFPSDVTRNVRVEISLPPRAFTCGATLGNYSNLLTGSLPGDVTIAAKDFTNGVIGADVTNPFLSPITNGHVFLQRGVYKIEKEVLINDIPQSAADNKTYLDYYIDRLEENYEGWTLTNNCCGPITLPASQWSCDTETDLDCGDATYDDDVNEIVNTLITFIDKEIKTEIPAGSGDYYEDLLTDKSTLLSKNMDVSEDNLRDLIDQWICGDGITIPSTQILSCISLYGQLLENNINLAESMQSGSISNPGANAQAFDPEFDFLLAVFNCLSISDDPDSKFCNYWVDIAPYGSNGTNSFIGSAASRAGNNKGVIITYYRSGNGSTGDTENDMLSILDNNFGLNSDQIKLVEIAPPVITQSNQVSDEVMFQDNCLKHLYYPNALMNTGSEDGDRAGLAEAACNCLESKPEAGVGDTKDEILNSAISADQIMDCINVCDENKAMFEVAYYNAEQALNIKENKAFGEGGAEWKTDILDEYVDKDCAIEVMIADCKSKCSKPMHQILEDKLQEAVNQSGSIPNFSSSNFVGSTRFSDGSVINWNTIPWNSLNIQSVYNNHEVQEILAQEKQNVEDVLIGAAEFAPVIPDGYLLSDYSGEVKDDLIEYLYDKLELGMTRRQYGTVPFHSSHSLVGLTSGANRYTNEFSKTFSIHESGDVLEVEAWVHVIFDNNNSITELNDDKILEINFEVKCSGGAELFSWAVSPDELNDINHCGIFYGWSAAGYNVQQHIAHFFFDQFNTFHAVPSDNMCWIATPKWYHYNNVSEYSHTASVEINMSASQWSSASQIWLRYDDDGDGENLMSNPVNVTGLTAQQKAESVAAEINSTASNPICRAEVVGTVVKLYVYDDEELHMGSSRIEQFYSPFTTEEFKQVPEESLADIRECEPATNETSDCPYGYYFVKGNELDYQVDVMNDKVHSKAFGDDVASFWKTAFNSIVNERSPVSQPIFSNAYSAPSSTSLIKHKVEVYEYTKQWVTNAGVITGIMHVEAQVSEVYKSQKVTTYKPNFYNGKYVEDSPETEDVISETPSSTENRIISARLVLRRYCEDPNEYKDLVDVTIGKNYDYCIPGFTQYTGSKFTHSNSGPSYVPYMYSDNKRRVFEDIIFKNDHFIMDLNPKMLSYIEIGKVSNTGLSGYYSADIGSLVPITFTKVGSTVSTTSNSNYKTFEFEKCGIKSLECDICMKYSFDLDYTPENVDVPLTCEEIAQQNQNNQIRSLLTACLENKTEELITTYKTCVTNYSDDLALTYKIKVGQYTLYYYDRAGNLITTVPPNGVKLLTSAQLDDVRSFRDDFDGGSGSGLTPVLPKHTMKTLYKYNSLKQLIWQSTPDGGESKFGYNRLGQLILSQNANQAGDNEYSYSLYDNLGRIIEVGQFQNTGTAISFDHFNIMAAKMEDDPLGSSYAGNFDEVVKTYYGTKRESGVTINNQSGGSAQLYDLNNVRNRVEKTEKFDNNGNFVSRTYYSYDIHGNVEILFKEIPELGFKQVSYEYDLVSGNVNLVKYNMHYQEDSNGDPIFMDQFYHRYTYDEDNRITEVYSSVDSIIWEEDATYDYYLHGPLSRTELGQDKVQGLDYSYTLQGFLKSVNGVDLDKMGKYDKGADGAYTAEVTFTVTGMNTGDQASITLNIPTSSGNQSKTYTIVANSDNVDEYGLALQLAQEINKAYVLNSSLDKSLKAKVTKEGVVKVYVPGYSSIQSTGFTCVVGQASSGVSITSDVNQFRANDVATDAFAMELGYFKDDYYNAKAHVGKGSINDPYKTGAIQNFTSDQISLYNGNISTWQSNTFESDLNVKDFGNKINVYKYDALNRLLSSDFQTWGGTGFNDYGSNSYDESFTYDGNGNIMTANRYGTPSEGQIDELRYKYNLNPNGAIASENNRLTQVIDGMGSADPREYHIGNQEEEHTYEYDNMGNLVHDIYNELNIQWTVSGKVKSVEESSRTINFTYDESGNRITKETLTSSGVLVNKLYYIRDASGNVMAIYEKKKAGSGVTLELKESPIYGSDRVGAMNRFQELYSTTTGSVISASAVQTVFNEDYSNKARKVIRDREEVSKFYELKDHLGNVRSVVTDRKILDEGADGYLEFNGAQQVTVPNASNLQITGDLTI